MTLTDDTAEFRAACIHLWEAAVDVGWRTWAIFIVAVEMAFVAILGLVWAVQHP